jgi:hypothetical protein
MAAGLLANTTLAQVNAQAGTIALNVVQYLTQAAEFQAFLGGSTTVLTSAPISMGGTDATNTLNAIQNLYLLDQILLGNAWVNYGILSVTVNNGGSGFTGAPTITYGGGSGYGFTFGTPVVSGEVVTSVPVTNPGYAVTSAPSLGFTGGGGTGLTMTPVLGAYISAPTGDGGLVTIASGLGFNFLSAISTLIGTGVH